MAEGKILGEEGNPTAQNLGAICPAFSLVLPVYNEELGITTTLDHLQETLQGVGSKYELVVVNDGSTDRSGEILRARSDIRLVEHPRNRGYGAALKTGIQHAQYPLIVITDADGTYPNERIPELVALAMHADMVVGARIGANVQYSNIRKIPKWFLVHFAQWVVRRRIPDLNSGLRVFHKSVVERFLNILPDTFSFTTTITLAMLTNHYLVHYEPIDYRFRVGKSKIKPIRDTLGFIQLILRTGVYFAPLRVFLPVAGIFFAGFLFTLFQDIFVREDLTERTLILFVAATQIAMFSLLADMIDKRNMRL
ncbi:glycosyltransferase family 2 protein [Microcoleus sp. FACHB-672]|jgi:glycosyltransferase involved in cell wall biosynthesis|uniref:glycosyltransferase family 2 protein n=1 Tax=Microcoleus sp. FACHB-672 TaxID=2692825 RepID=UPI0016889A2C|nr:glycosyltransferase family 2 protein [Microcoleus sp. FACHB-672]MBD2041734.1 glycosyltransferase family 2 protein [Microcoleus sp. FACHB-672]MBW4678657.1 glycosyltransferase [Microcoleus vaginatus WJT46-NPBG5]